MSEEPLMVDCGEHGERVASLVCCHHVRCKDRALGFIENKSDPDDLQAWCYACEYLYNLEGDMTDKFESFCDPKIVCVDCYAKIKKFNTV